MHANMKRNYANISPSPLIPSYILYFNTLVLSLLHISGFIILFVHFDSLV